MLPLISIALTATFKGVQDLQAHGKLGFTGAWWNQDSWKLKWKDGNPALGERFLGSSTVLVWATDAWHFFGMLRNVAMILSIVFYAPIGRWWLDVLMLFLVHNIVFELFYRFLPILIKGFIK